MHKCPDGKGGTTFQQSPCPETPEEIEARAKEKERLKQEEARKKEEDARKKEEQVAKAKERDKAYQQQMEERAQESKKAEEVQKRLLEGTAQEVSDGTLTAEMEKLYPAPWIDRSHPGLTAALGKANAKGCDKFRYRQRVGGGSGEYLVHCTTDGRNWATQYFVWLASGSVKGPFKL